MPKKYFLPFLLVGFLVFLLLVVIGFPRFFPKKNIVEQTTSLPTDTPKPTPTPTPKPLTFAEMNKLYGPCTRVPVLMYHHVQDMALAKTKNQSGLTVDTVTFREQMQYLKDKGYQAIRIDTLVNFFDSGTPVPTKSFLITFDDGYDDVYLNALPVLREMGFPAIVYLSTGLVNNPAYITWDQVMDASGSQIFFGNHTWSHKNMLGAYEEIKKEITLADTQLAERGLNGPKTIAYPYGFENNNAEKIVSELGYKIGFTTKPGSTLCVKQKYSLPRIRVGNTAIGAYGF